MDNVRLIIIHQYHVCCQNPIFKARTELTTVYKVSGWDVLPGVLTYKTHFLNSMSV